MREKTLQAALCTEIEVGLSSDESLLLLRFRDAGGRDSAVALKTNEALDQLLGALSSLSSQLWNGRVPQGHAIVGFGCEATKSGGRVLDIQTQNEEVQRFALGRETALLLAQALATGWTEAEDSDPPPHLNS